MVTRTLASWKRPKQVLTHGTLKKAPASLARERRCPEESNCLILCRCRYQMLTGLPSNGAEEVGHYRIGGARKLNLLGGNCALSPGPSAGSLSFCLCGTFSG